MQNWSSDWTEGKAFKDMTSADMQQWPTVTAHAPGAPLPTGQRDTLFNPNHWGGEKYPGGLGAVADLLTLDYWELRERSNELFHKNIYARGFIRRIVTNVIANKLHLEAVPEESVIGVPEDSLLEWSESVETLYELYSETPEIVDYRGRHCMGQIQRQALTEALVGGDCLTILRQSKKHKLPSIEVVSGDRIRTPAHLIGTENVIDGVEIDSRGRHIAFFVVDQATPGVPEEYTRVLAYGARTGRLQAKLIYGIEKREDGVRGEPMLSIAIQSLTEIDKHRDATQRQATMNAMYVAAVTRSDNKRPTTPLTGRSGGAARRGSNVDVVDNATGETRRIPMSDLVPGMNIETLSAGENIQFFNNAGQNINFGGFETTILMALSWAFEIPPEIMFLSFNKSFSASQSAVNELGIFLNKERSRFSSQFCDFVYQDWFLSGVLLDKINAPGFLSAKADPEKWDIARAWVRTDWMGAVKPSADILKTAKGLKLQIDEGLITRERACRQLNGMKLSKVLRKLIKENELLSQANKPLKESESRSGFSAAANENETDAEGLKAVMEEGFAGIMSEMEATG